MRYFTRSFINGSWSQERRRKAVAAYDAHVSALGLSPSLQMLWQISFHDARILAFTYERSAGTLKLRMRRGDLQAGYWDVTLCFSEAAITAGSLRLLRDAVRPSNVEVLATELEESIGLFKYRLLFWPKGEATLTFKGVVIKSRAVSSRVKFLTPRIQSSVVCGPTRC